ncbi:MAG: dienelactone hydrolase family protein [Bryobacteraceae bacterium]
MRSGERLRSSETHAVRIPPIGLEGDLAIPRGAEAVAVFAHGSGSSRFSPRNRLVAAELRKAGLATLLMDLLTAEEERTKDLRFEIPLLADRVVLAAEWLRSTPETEELQIGYFGASTGAAAALVAAARSPESVYAVVSRGGRPDLAGEDLGAVEAPTLFIVGGEDDVVLDLNRQAQRQLRCPSRLAVIPGATHLFEEPGALDEVTRLAREWFLSHLAGRTDAEASTVSSAKRP